MSRTALIVGADRVAGIRAQLLESELGLSDIEHWDGRAPSHAKRRIPSTTALVVCITARVGHMVQKHVKAEAAQLGVPILFCRHSAIELRERLQIFKKTS